MDTKADIERKQQQRKSNDETVQIKEYDELQCRKCDKIMNVDKTLTMIDGYRGVCLCPHCGKKNKVVKTRPADEDYNVGRQGTRTRKNPKLHMSKKARRKLNKELRNEQEQ